VHCNYKRIGERCKRTVIIYKHFGRIILELARSFQHKPAKKLNNSAHKNKKRISRDSKNVNNILLLNVTEYI
jgi:hypothetical protein